MQTYYHCSPQAFEIRASLKPLRRERLERDSLSPEKFLALVSKKMLFLEEMLERIRRGRFNDKPPRFESIFAYERLEDFENPNKENVYIIGGDIENAFRGYQYHYNLALGQGRGPCAEDYLHYREVQKKMEKIAIQYWEHVKPSDEFSPRLSPEILLKGKLIVLEKVKK